eukprot:scaffold32101_cov50-Attheya_sp.AAC.4
MKFSLSVTAAALCGASVAAAFAPQYSNGVRTAFSPRVSTSVVQMADEQFDQEAFIAESKDMRMKHLEEQAMFALKIACENYSDAGEYTHETYYI